MQNSFKKTLPRDSVSTGYFVCYIVDILQLDISKKNKHVNSKIIWTMFAVIRSIQVFILKCLSAASLEQNKFCEMV